MITIEIKDKIYYMANNIDELTLGRFMNASNIKSEEENDRLIELISTLSDIPSDILLDLPYSEFIRLSNACQFLNNEVNNKPEYTFELDGIKYGMQFEWSKMTTAEYLDIDHFSKDNHIENLHILMSIIYRPIIKEYEELDYEIEPYNSNQVFKRAKLFYDKMPAKYAISASVFFCLIGMNCLECIQDYSLKLNQKLKKKRTYKKKNKKKDSMKNGDGNIV